MIAIRTITLLFLAQSVLGQVYCVRIISHTPHYERILLSKGDPLRSPTLRGVDDLAAADLYRGTNRIDSVFADSSRERTNGFFASCLSEVPVGALSLRCPGGLLTSEEVGELLRDTVSVPRSCWTNHMTPFGSWRYVFSLVGSKSGEYVIDERAGACALVFFPDGTYRCVMDPKWECVKALQQDGAANGSQPIRSKTNQTSSAAGSRR
jgi:hypothetical protein